MRPVVNYFFDTNIYRHLSRKHLQIPHNKDKRVALSFISAFELVDQLQRSSPANFDEIKSAIGLARKHMNKKYLMPPYDFLARTLFGRPDDKCYLNHSRKGFELASRVRMHADVSRPIRYGDKFFKLQDFSKPRMDHQDSWIRGVGNARECILKDAGVEPLTPQSMLLGKKSQEFIRFLKTPGWLEFFAKIVIPEDGPDDRVSALVRTIPQSLHAAATFFASCFGKCWLRDTGTRKKRTMLTITTSSITYAGRT